jgi:hypothetical protein
MSILPLLCKSIVQVFETQEAKKYKEVKIFCVPLPLNCNIRISCASLPLSDCVEKQEEACLLCPPPWLNFTGFKFRIKHEEV